MMSPFVVMGYTRTYNTQRSTSQSSTRLPRGKKNINERPWAFSQLHASWSCRSYSGCELKSWIRNEQPHRCLSEHRSEAQFPRCSTEFLVRIEEVTHASLQQGGTGKREKKHHTLQTCAKSHFSLSVLNVWLGGQALNKCQVHLICSAPST